ncbi:uncharacterized protein LOC125189330 [Salvia hispanica]|uniref:uncharacterized protein LOC125189330 n=1 Tax=Salvia hispanica TaxID=49212 RepID=UPI0020090AA4|nr:uncharacterized protein LOC125189330 [Salvia hispanica]
MPRPHAHGARHRHAPRQQCALLSLRIPDLFVGLLSLAIGSRSKASMWAMEQSSSTEELTISSAFSFHTDVMPPTVDVSRVGVEVARPFTLIERIVQIYSATARNWEKTPIENAVNVVFAYAKLIEEYNNVSNDHSKSTATANRVGTALVLLQLHFLVAAFPTGHCYYDFHFHFEDEPPLFFFHDPP